MTIQAQKPHNNVRITFDDFRILKVSFEVRDKVSNEGVVEPGIGLAHTYDKDEKTLNIFLKIWMQEGPQPYVFEVTSGGRFILSDEPDEKTLVNFTRINCPAIMYPYVRETIADLTRRAGFQPLHLPPVNFVHLDLQPKRTVLKQAKHVKRELKKK